MKMNADEVIGKIESHFGRKVYHVCGVLTGENDLIYIFVYHKNCVNVIKSLFKNVDNIVEIRYTGTIKALTI